MKNTLLIFLYFLLILSFTSTFVSAAQPVTPVDFERQDLVSSRFPTLTMVSQQASVNMV